MRISIFNSKELQGLIVSLKAMDRELAKQIRQQSKRVIQPEWQKAVSERASTPLESRVLGATARATISNQNVQLQSAKIGRSMSGGAKPAQIMAGVEFGADRGKRVRGRQTQRQFRPRNRKGYVVYPAAADLIPRIASLWVQTTVRTFYELAERR